jgi:hypothetical protein
MDCWCIIGAGPCGLAAQKNFRQAGIPYVAFERDDDVGGAWNAAAKSARVYDSAHLISSKRLTEYVDFPMPDDYPAYPSAKQAHAYLRSYADAFELRDSIRFQTSVLSAVRSEGGWLVRTDRDAEPIRFAGLVIANGHHWDPLIPEWPGEFSGDIFHSRDYREPSKFAGKRVLVVGAGNSGCDVAVEACQVAERVVHSLRRGYHVLPKFLLGKPIDLCGERLLRWRLPLWLRRRIAGAASRISLGSPARFGVPAPDHALFEAHPIVNSQWLYFLGHGRIAVKPQVERFAGDLIRFADGSEEAFDDVVMATGYRVSFPFLDEEELPRPNGAPDLYLNAFDRTRDDLIVIGMIQPDSGLWGLADLQSRLAAEYLSAIRDGDDATAAAFRAEKATARPDLGFGVRYLDTPRHRLEVEHFAFRRLLERKIATLRTNRSRARRRPAEPRVATQLG